MAFRLALIGAGRIGSFHAAALQKSTEVSVTAVVDPRPEAATGIGTSELTRLSNVEELTKAGGVDGALIAAPTALHRALIEQLAEAHIPVLCEKPCGINSSEARAIARLVEEHGSFLRVAFWRRQVPELREIRERIIRGDFGEISAVLSAQWDELPPSAEFRNPELSGGLVIDMGVHEFDVVRWLTGQEVVDVSGFASTVCSDPPVPDDPESASVTVQLSAGSTALISLGRRHPPGEMQKVWVIGTKDAVALALIGSTPDAHRTMSAAFRQQTEAFARSLHGAGDPQLARIQDAIAALEAAEATTNALGGRLASDPHVARTK